MAKHSPWNFSQESTTMLLDLKSKYNPNLTIKIIRGDSVVLVQSYVTTPCAEPSTVPSLWCKNSKAAKIWRIINLAYDASIERMLSVPQFFQKKYDFVVTQCVFLCYDPGYESIQRGRRRIW